MLRRARAASFTQSFTLRISACDKTTGFSVFACEVQKKVHILKATSLGKGKSNMVIMSYLWNQLSKRDRDKYNDIANKRDCFRVRSVVKRNNSFNLLMRLFARNGMILGAGDEKFVTMMAKKTSAVLPKNSIEAICNALQVSAPSVTPVSSSSSTSQKDSVLQLAKTASERQQPLQQEPDMKYFTSFTEMQRAVAPTRKSCYVGVCKSLANHIERHIHAVSMHRCFDSLSAEEQNTFMPITNEEASAFETFCAKHASGMDVRHFDISTLFAQFRGIAAVCAVAAGDLCKRDKLYRALIAEDKVQDGLYSRVRRALHRIEALRSSDCGPYLLQRMPKPVYVHPNTYGLLSHINEVAVSTLLASTRRNQCVYDDILQRAAILRPRHKVKRLAMYVLENGIRKSTHNTQTHAESAQIKVLRNRIAFTEKQLQAAIAQSTIAATATARQRSKPSMQKLDRADLTVLQTSPQLEKDITIKKFASLLPQPEEVLTAAEAAQQQQREHFVRHARVPTAHAKQRATMHATRQTSAKKSTSLHSHKKDINEVNLDTHLLEEDALVRAQPQTRNRMSAVLKKQLHRQRLRRIHASALHTLPASHATAMPMQRAEKPIAAIDTEMHKTGTTHAEHIDARTHAPYTAFDKNSKVPIDVQNVRSNLIKMQPATQIIIKLPAEHSTEKGNPSLISSSTYSLPPAPVKRGASTQVHPQDTFAAELRAQLAAVL